MKSKRTPVKQSRNDAVVDLRDNGKTFYEIGELFNISSVRARQIYRKHALKLLKQSELEYNPLLTPEDVMRELDVSKNELSKLVKIMRMDI